MRLEYTKALEKIKDKLKFGSKPGLGRLKNLMQKINNPQDKLKFIHVSGTNGKGSVCSVLSSVLSEAGLKTGMYTSPSVTDFRERIQICGQLIPKKEICKLVELFENLESESEFEKDPITEFELTTAMAFQYFYQEKCDVVVLETGLGGRLDATNIIKKNICSIITSVSKDHTQILGESLYEIASEKAGIIKPLCPVVLGPKIPEEALKAVFEKAKSSKSQVYQADLSEISNIVYERENGTSFEYHGLKLKTHLLGKHQIKNISTALEALKILKKDFIITDNAISSGISKAFIPCRLEIIKRNPFIILDGAHNPDGAESLKNFITDFFKNKKLLGIVGMFKDKDYKNVIKKTAPLFSEIYAVETTGDRALPSEKISNEARKYNSKTKSFKNVKKALKNILETNENYDGIIIFGSFSIMKEAKDFINKNII